MKEQENIDNKEIEAIIFDLDGTLWDPTDVVLKSWNITLANNKTQRGPITKEELQSYMGLQLVQIGERAFPDLDENVRMQIMTDSCNFEQDMIRKEGGQLYPKLEETLKALSQKYTLLIVSNCQAGYIEAFMAFHKLDKYFKDFEFARISGNHKGDNIKLIIERNNISRAVYVGDTQGDCDGANIAGIPFVYASFGFGSVDRYDYVIEEIEGLCEIFLKRNFTE
jgi:phosphoglycolate phosphatase